MDFTETAGVDMCVYLHGADVGVAEHSLDLGLCYARRLHQPLIEKRSGLLFHIGTNIVPSHGKFRFMKIGFILSVQ